MKTLLKRLFRRKQYTLGPQVFHMASWLEKQVNAEMLKQRMLNDYIR
jgi:hypothetical protein